MPPIISIVGPSNSGKTTFLVKLIAALTARGYRVATVKHTSEDISFDKPDKDTWRHLEAGSSVTTAVSGEQMALIRRLDTGFSLHDIARLLGEDYDIILTEGFKKGDAPKIEVHRRESGARLQGVKKIIAVATDETLEESVRQFPLDDAAPLADFIEQGFLKPQSERLSVYVNGVPLTLSAFPRELVTNVLLAMADSLKGVGKVENLDISLRRRGGD